MARTLEFEVVPVLEAMTNTTPVGDAMIPDEQLPIPNNQPPVILIVDDEKLIADTLSAILTRFGMTTMTAYDAVSALHLARTRSPEVLLTDVAMPGMDGIELAIALTRSSPTCKVLLFSGHASSAHLLEARGAGHNFPLMSKPIHPVDMVKRVTEVITERIAEMKARRGSSHAYAEEPMLLPASA